MTFAGHVIRKGDTLSRIAHRYDAPVQDIIEVNDMRAGNKLRVGHQLLIPRPAGRVAARRAGAAAHARTVAMKTRQPAARTDRTALRVRAGDTLWSISKRFDVDLLDLCRWNGIKDPDQHNLLAGSRLDVYPEGG
jgi:membrane-bound lytic murein transglycosylase D